MIRAPGGTSPVAVVVGLGSRGPAPAEPHPAADVWGLEALATDAVHVKEIALVNVWWYAEQCAEANPVHKLSQRAAGDGTT